jgi:drug/metabolite transporter (DMT)-like permease
VIRACLAVTDPLGHVFWWGILAVLIGGAIFAFGALTGNRKLQTIGGKIMFAGIFVWLAIMAYVFFFFYSHLSH